MPFDQKLEILKKLNEAMMSWREFAETFHGSEDSDK